MEIQIVGGGVIGLCSAWRLAARGAKVTLREAGVLAGEASSAAAGMLAPGGEFAADSLWARLAVAALKGYPAFTGELGVPVDFRVCGALELAYSIAEAVALHAKVARQDSLGIRALRISNAQAGRMAPIRRKDLIAAVHYPAEAVVDPRRLCQALIAKCRETGVTLIERSRVDNPEDLEADAVVIAAGAWSPGSFPVKGHIAKFRMQPGWLVPVVRRGHHYIVQREDGSAIAGSNEERAGFDRTPNEAAIGEIAAAARYLLPDLDLPVESWCGFRPGSPTGYPIVERSGESRIWRATGHYRNGILLSNVTARMLAGFLMPNSGKD